MTQRVEHTTMTTNHIANYIARKGIVKHMTRDAALAIWADLRADGWIRGEGSSLIKPQDEEGTFHFVKVSETKTNVFYACLEVAS